VTDNWTYSNLSGISNKAQATLRSVSFGVEFNIRASPTFSYVSSTPGSIVSIWKMQCDNRKSPWRITSQGNQPANSWACSCWSRVHICYLLAGRSVFWKTDQGLENAALGLWPRTAFSSPRSQFFTIWTNPKPVKNVYFFSCSKLVLQITNRSVYAALDLRTIY